jgi:hypothetical protein
MRGKLGIDHTIGTLGDRQEGVVARLREDPAGVIADILALRRTAA